MSNAAQSFKAAAAPMPGARNVDVFMGAASDGDVAGLKAFIDEYGPGYADVTRGEPIHWTALMWAAKAGKCDAVEYLIDHGAAFDQRDGAGSTPLLWAAGMGRADVVDLLVARGADVAVCDRDGRTPAGYARASGHEKIAEKIEAEIAAREQRRLDAERRKREELESAVRAFTDGMRETRKSGRFRLHIGGKGQGAP